MRRSRSLKRSMRVVGALLLTLSAITPASSVFVIVPGVVHQAGTGAFLSMAATAFVSLLIAYVYSELSSAFPIAGGEYCMVGKTLGSAAGFATLSLTAFGNMLAPAVLSLGAADYLHVFLPHIQARVVAVAFIALTTLLSILHIRTNAWVTGAFLLLEIAALFSVTVLGFSHIHLALSAMTFHPQMLTSGQLAPTALSAVGVSAASAIFAYNGYGSAVYFAEEMHEAPKVVARTIMWAFVLAVATELIPITAVLMGAPDTKKLLESDSPFTYFMLAVSGPALNMAVSLAVALAIFNAVLATVMQNGRFFFSTGRDGTWHPWINDAFTLTHARFHSPWVATLASGASAVVMCFFPLKWLLVMTGTEIAIVYMTLSLAALIGRRAGATDHAHYRMPLFPFVPLLALGALGLIVAVNWYDPDIGRPSLIANAVVVAASMTYYFVFVRKRGSWQVHVPEDEPLSSDS